MTRQVVITEKASQARDVRAAVGSRYGTVLAALPALLVDEIEVADMHVAMVHRCTPRTATASRWNR